MIVAKEIMYVGRKDQKVDNKNNNHGRIWRGLGQVITGIPDVEASKLCEHPDIWMDVSNVKQKEREAIIASLQEKYRAEARAARAGQAITLDNATEEELQSAIKKLRSTRGKAADNKVDKGLIPPAAPQAGAHGNESDTRHRPETTDDLAAEIFGAIAELDSERDFDGEGKPYLERVTAKLGYQVTQKELDDVWTAYNDK
jgi:hypothetical protein